MSTYKENYNYFTHGTRSRRLYNSPRLQLIQVSQKCKVILQNYTLYYSDEEISTESKIPYNSRTGKQIMFIYVLIHNLQSWTQRIYPDKQKDEETKLYSKIIDTINLNKKENETNKH